MEEIISVSVIIAVYNDEKNISRCLESVINQTLKNIQILCVNDASTDNTLEILNKYAEKDSRIVIINNAVNGGMPSKARNKALEFVKGQYIITIDSDDYVSLDCLEKAFKIAIDTSADGVVSKEVGSYDNDPFPEPPEWKDDFKTGATITGKEALTASLDGWKIHPRTLWKFSLFDNFRFDEGGVYGDEFSAFYLYSICKTVSFADGVYYYYRNNSSITHQRNEKMFDRMDRQLKMRDLMKKHGIYEILFHSFESENLIYLKQYHYLYFKLRKQLTKEKNAEVKKRLKEFYHSFNPNNIDVLETNKTPMNTILNKIRFSSYMSFYYTAWILSLAVNRRQCDTDNDRILNNK